MRRFSLVPFYALVCVGGALTAGCGASTSEPAPGPPPLLEALPRSLTVAEQHTISAVNRFAFGLFGTINEAEADKNVFISPVSASMALGMVLNGARGTTLDSMRIALGFDQRPIAEIAASYQTLLALLRSLDAQGTTFEIANSVWGHQGFEIAPDFVAVLKQYFDAEARNLDFRSPAAVTTINDWVNTKTHEKIPTIIESIDPLEVMFLINAIYFKGSWRTQFDPAETRAAPFTAIDGTTAEVRLMHQEKELRYVEGTDYEAVELYYGNGAFAMTVVLPRAGTNVNGFVKGLSPERWNDLTGRLRTSKVNLYLPKFTLNYRRSMKDDLTALGMGIAFSDRANFGGISDRQLELTRVVQKTYVDVNEEGTEAAAVTAVGVGVTSAPVIPTVRVDRPFVVVLRERLTGAIVFVGKIARLGS